MGTISTSDIASVSKVAPAHYVVTAWTVEGDPVELAAYGTRNRAEKAADDLARVVRSWLEP